MWSCLRVLPSLEFWLPGRLLSRNLPIRDIVLLSISALTLCASVARLLGGVTQLEKDINIPLVLF